MHTSSNIGHCTRDESRNGSAHLTREQLPDSAKGWSWERRGNAREFPNLNAKLLSIQHLPACRSSFAARQSIGSINGNGQGGAAGMLLPSAQRHPIGNDRHARSGSSRHHPNSRRCDPHCSVWGSHRIHSAGPTLRGSRASRVDPVPPSANLQEDLAPSEVRK